MSEHRITCEDAICGWCKAAIDLNDQSEPSTWIEGDEFNVCRPCFDAFMDGTKEEQLERYVAEIPDSLLSSGEERG